MNKEQILQLLTDYCRTMLYGGKTLTEVESFLHVLRKYLQHGEFMRIFRNLKRLEESLAYTQPTRDTALPRHSAQAFSWLDVIGYICFVYLGVYYLTQSFPAIPLDGGTAILAVVIKFLFQQATKAYTSYVAQRHTGEEMRTIWHTWEWQSLFMSLWLIFNIWNPIFLYSLGHTVYYCMLACLCFAHTPMWVNWSWRGRIPEETIFRFPPSGSLRQTSRLNHQQNIPEPEKVVIDFIEFFEEEARRRREELEGSAR
jgi:hypothetical protein